MRGGTNLVNDHCYEFCVFEKLRDIGDGTVELEVPRCLRGSYEGTKRTGRERDRLEKCRIQKRRRGSRSRKIFGGM